MLTPDKEIILANYCYEYEFGSKEKADQLHLDNVKKITQKDIQKWEMKHERIITGWKKLNCEKEK